MYTFETEKGNIATSVISQYDAEAKAQNMDDYGCTDCTDCTGCAGCMGCTGCNRCTNCEWCTGCNRCTNCKYCSHCRDCVDCRDCNDCTNWGGKAVRSLICINAIPFPITVSDTHMQIGCINETRQWWHNASDEDVAAKGGVEVADVEEYRLKYGALIAAALEVRQ